MSKMKQLLKKSDSLVRVVQFVKLFSGGALRFPDGGRKQYPKVIQLPITYKCNSRCVMCNIWKMDHSNEAGSEEFKKFIHDPLFKQVTAVGINGGEPSLVRALPGYAREILKLPSIKSLNVISHGFNKKLLLQSLEKIYRDCRKSGVSFHVSISLDGVGAIHDKVRGINGVFKKTISTVDDIVENRVKYCDSLDLGCTITKQNIENLVELDEFIKKKNITIKYRLGIDNKRIESDKLRDQYTVIYSPLSQTASEFFHWQFSRAENIRDKFKYFAIFYWLISKKKKRLLGCAWKEEGVTLDSRGSLYYCAVASDEIGSLRMNSGEDIFFNDKNLNYRKEIIKNSCDTCIHDYYGKPHISGLLIFIRYVLKNRLAMMLYRLRLQFGAV